MILPIVFLGAWWLLWLAPLQNYGWWKRFILYGGLTALLLYAGIATLGVYYDRIYPWCELTKEATLFVGPDTTYAARGSVSSGTKVRCMQQCGAWRKIKHDTLIGWVVADCMSE